MRRLAVVVGFLVLAVAGAAGVGVLMVRSGREWRLPAVESGLVDVVGLARGVLTVLTALTLLTAVAGLTGLIGGAG